MKQNPEDVIPAYVRAFETLEPNAVVPFYSLPCVFIAPSSMTVISDVDSARALVSLLIEQAKSQNYRRTEILGNMEVRRLAANLASVAGAYVRFDANDREIMRFGFTYVMRDDGDRWRIIVALAHDLPPTSGLAA